VIFVTVGSMFPYDRLIRAMDEIAGNDLNLRSELFAQIGEGSYVPLYMKYVRFLDKIEFGLKLRQCRAVVSHAGIGTIAECLATGLPMLALPRKEIFGEHVNDHQLATAQKFFDLKHILLAKEAEDLQVMLPKLEGFLPRRRVTSVGSLAEAVGRELNLCSKRTENL
jgi:beta-1,4-N-acetylglucosaminyltransferase